MRAAGGGERPKGHAPFPWEAAMAFGLGRLRLDPAAFWRLTPLELAALCGNRRGFAPVRDELAALMRLYPDGEND
ncbi:rcc01693 family protein [Pararhizobium mangrovi]|uniref:Phage tail assembly chaperone n=1 Tax=Pararhizobium mangrovi TaxID=2590452 RepID=A0A506UHH8_9HYPH|nr:rcc01693 family protein [Pararhizobium mangrovi]TPW32761.1 phage tail assembly chaperone [Pararhizobium mangrovi]